MRFLALALAGAAEEWRPRSSFLLQPTVRRPFVFYHIDKTAGSSLRAVISAASARLRLPAVIPCHNRVTCLCGANFRVEPLMCPAPADFRDAAVIAGHFSPPGLYRRRYGLRPSACLVMLRDPLSRHASFYKYYHHGAKFFGNRTFADLTLVQHRAAIALSGGNAFMTQFLACDDIACAGTANATAAAAAALRRCHVGTTERYNTTMALLSLAAPWLGTYADLSRTHANRATEPGGANVAEASPGRAKLLAADMPDDYALYDLATSLARRRLEAASHCGAPHARPRADAAHTSPAHHEMAIAIQIEVLARVMSHRRLADRARFACCVDKRLHDVDPTHFPRNARCPAESGAAPPPR